MIKRFLAAILSLCVTSCFVVPGILAAEVHLDQVATTTVNFNSTEVQMADQSESNLIAAMPYYSNENLFNSGENCELNINASLDCEIIFDSLGEYSSPVSVDGTLTLAGCEYDFSATGNVRMFEATNNDSVYIGSASGYAGQTSDSFLTLTICYNMTTEETFIPICLGSYGDDDNPPLQLEFGTPFASLNSATEAFLSDFTERQSNGVNELSDTATPSANRINVDSKCLAVEPGEYLGEEVVYCSYYGSDEAFPSGSWTGYIRAHANIDAFEQAYEDSLTSSSLIVQGEGYHVETVWFYCSTSNSSCKISDVFPENEERVIAFGVPFETPSAVLNYLASFVTINIPVNGVKSELTNAQTNLDMKIWNNVGGLTNIETTSNTPNAENGTGVTCWFTIFDGLNSGRTLTVTAQTRCEVCFIAVQSDGLSYPKYVTVDSGEANISLDSVAS